jgi:hypothetical protein
VALLIFGSAAVADVGALWASWQHGVVGEIPISLLMSINLASAKAEHCVTIL